VAGCCEHCNEICFQKVQTVLTSRGSTYYWLVKKNSAPRIYQLNVCSVSVDIVSSDQVSSCDRHQRFGENRCLWF